MSLVHFEAQADVQLRAAFRRFRAAGADEEAAPGVPQDPDQDSAPQPGPGD